MSLDTLSVNWEHQLTKHSHREYSIGECQPGDISLGDIVEIVCSVRAYKKHNGDWRSRLILRGVMLLDKELSKVNGVTATSVLQRTEVIVMEQMAVIELRERFSDHRPKQNPERRLKRKFTYAEEQRDHRRRLIVSDDTDDTNSTTSSTFATSPHINDSDSDGSLFR